MRTAPGGLLFAYHSSCVFVLLNKASDLLSRVARNLAQELAYQTFILSLERVIVEVFEGVFSPSVALILRRWCDGGIHCADEKLANLFKGLDLLNIHNDVHPAIMDEASLIVEY